METNDNDIIIPIKLHESIMYGDDKFVKVIDLAQNRFFHKLYIVINDGKVQTNKIIKVVNENIFELDGNIFIKGTSIEKDLVNGHEII